MTAEPATRFSIPAWPVTSARLAETIQSMLADGSWGQYEGRWTEQLRTELSAFFGRQHAHLCCSGTIATEIALHGLGVRPGQAIAMAGYDFSGNFRAIESTGCVPVLVDVVTGGWVMDPESLRNALNEDVAAIVVSHLHGQLADMAAIRSLAAEKNIPVVEDCCQVPGAVIGDKRAGSFGDVATFSFGGSKLLSCGRGGAILTDDESNAQRMKVFTDRGNDAFPLSQLQSACVTCQLDELDGMNRIRGAAVGKLAGRLQDSPMPVRLNGDQQPEMSAWYKVPFLLSEKMLTGSSRANWVGRFQEQGIPLDEGFRGFHLRSARRCRKPVELTNARIAAERTLLMHHPALLMDADGMEEMLAAIVQTIGT